MITPYIRAVFFLLLFQRTFGISMTQYSFKTFFIQDSSVVMEAAMEATEPLVGLDFHIDSDNLDIDTLRVRLLAMTEVLEQAREDAITSRLQLARFQRQHQNYLERHELQLQTLNR